jgi:arabinan endo-1,5-alpha-L-arabinosidase
VKTNAEIQMRDPFVMPVPEEGKYYLFGTTDPDCWRSPGIGFDVYIGRDLINWDGPFPAFRPEPGFWATTNFWAPEVHRYRGKWYMFASFKSPSRRRGTQILIADSPQGPYRPHSPVPVTPENWECLDGTFFLDDSGSPWIVFCHEWVQVGDGEVCALKLSSDLARTEGEPRLLFKGSEAGWTRPHKKRDGTIDPSVRVTDGPFVRREKDGRLHMLWSSFSEKGYAMGIAKSAGGILGPWVQEEAPIANMDSGHGMIFESFDGRLYMTIHSPNVTPNERPIFVEIEDTGDSLAVREMR